MNGFAATRIEDVARRAGITKGTVYLYFDSKETLFRALLEQESSRTFAEFDILLDTYDGTAPALLHLLIRQAGSQLLAGDLRHLIRLLIAEGPRFPDLLAFHHAQVIRGGRQRIERVIRYGIERGEFRDNGLADFPQIIIAGPMLAMLWESLFANLEPLNVETYLDTLADTLLRGVIHRS